MKTLGSGGRSASPITLQVAVNGVAKELPNLPYRPLPEGLVKEVQ